MSSQQASIPLSVSLISLSPDLTDKLACPSCREPMNLHQPEAGDPDRLLGTCGTCGGWFLMDLIPGGREAVLVILPDGDHLRAAAGR